MIKEFNYTKDNGSTSDRKVFVLEKPSDYLFGIDLSEFDEEEANIYIEMLNKVVDDYKDSIKDIVTEYKLGYRKFKKGGISESI